MAYEAVLYDVADCICTITLNRHRMNAGDPVERVAASDPNAVQLICEGKAIPYCRVRIADDEDRELPEDRIGHVHMTGDNVTRGYYEDPQANAAAFTADGWLRTGDLGLMHGGELYISGRAKEIIFVNGQNYYPHDLEAIAQRAPGLELGKVVAAGVRPRGAETEQLVVFVLHRGGLPDLRLSVLHGLRRAITMVEVLLPRIRGVAGIMKPHLTTGLAARSRRPLRNGPDLGGYGTRLDHALSQFGGKPEQHENP